MKNVNKDLLNEVFSLVSKQYMRIDKKIVEKNTVNTKNFHDSDIDKYLKLNGAKNINIPISDKDGNVLTTILGYILIDSSKGSDAPSITVITPNIFVSINNKFEVTKYVMTDISNSQRFYSLRNVLPKNNSYNIGELAKNYVNIYVKNKEPLSFKEFKI